MHHKAFGIMHSANKPSFDNKDYFHILKKKNYDINYEDNNLWDYGSPDSNYYDKYIPANNGSKTDKSDFSLLEKNIKFFKDGRYVTHAAVYRGNNSTVLEGRDLRENKRFSRFIFKRFFNYIITI